MFEVSTTTCTHGRSLFVHSCISATFAEFALCSIWKTASTIATSIVHANLDYCNSLFLNIDVTKINRLQAIQNALDRAVNKTPKHDHITPVLKRLHWLRITERLQYKVIPLTYNKLQSS